MDIHDKHGVPEELRYDNIKEESMPGTMIQRTMRNFYIIGRSSGLYTQQQNKCEGHIRDLQYQSKRQMINTNAPAPLWDLYIVTKSYIMSRMSIDMKDRFIIIKQ